MKRILLIPFVLALSASVYLWLNGKQYDAKLAPMREAMRWGVQ